MLRFAILFVVLAIVFGILGYGGAAAIAWEGAKILFWIFLVLVIISLFFGVLFSRQPPLP
jgi:uncharacterized membrane protein YtjA (UPF0391 family)